MNELEDLANTVDLSILSTDKESHDSSLLQSDKIDLLVINLDRPIVFEDDLKSCFEITNKLSSDCSDMVNFYENKLHIDSILKKDSINKELALYLNDLLDLNMSDDVLKQFTILPTKVNLEYIKRITSLKVNSEIDSELTTIVAGIDSVLESIVKFKPSLQREGLDNIIDKLESLKNKYSNVKSEIENNEKFDIDDSNNKTVFNTELNDCVFDNLNISKEIKNSFNLFYNKFEYFCSDYRNKNFIKDIFSGRSLNLRTYGKQNVVEDIDVEINLVSIFDLLSSGNLISLIRGFDKTIEEIERSFLSIKDQINTGPTPESNLSVLENKYFKIINNNQMIVNNSIDYYNLLSIICFINNVVIYYIKFLESFS